MDNKNNNTNEIKIELPAEVASGHYSNLAVIAHGAGEFYLDFIAVAPNMQQAKVQTRVIMTPENAKNPRAAHRRRTTNMRAITDNGYRHAKKSGHRCKIGHRHGLKI